MKAASPNPYSSTLLRKYAFVLVGWSVLVAMSLAWNIRQERGETIHMATATAAANINKDISFRKWVASHGGVYVEPSERTPPNPYLNVPDRDVVTTTGKALTLMNPAYTLREMQNYFGNYYGIRSHITSLKPLNPRNAADAWETGALKRFEQDSKEIMEVQQIDGQPYLRMMRPFFVEPDCLKCHAHQGYKVGDIRGGIGTDVSLASYLADERERNTTTTWSHGLIWLIGLLGSVFFYRRECYLDNERKQADAALLGSETRFRNMFENNASVMLLIEPSTGAIADANAAASRFYGYSVERMRAMNINQINTLTPAEIAIEMDSATRHERNYFIFLHRLANGEIRTVEVRSSPINTGERVLLFSIINDITERKQAEAEIKSLAFYDPLTHLPNRRLLMDRLKQALASSARSERKGALLFIDLDKFKTLNDTLGHDIGDLLLQQVAQRLESCVREGDTVARLGGDEFVVMLEDLSENNIEAAAQAEVVGEKILVTLNQPYQLAAHEHHSTPSIGVSLFSGSVLGQEELLQQADIAMYQAKKAGRNVLRFFDPAMQATITARAIQEADLRRAVAEQEKFTLYYQAQVDSSGRLIGAEALVRWQHPEHGMMLPGEFIPLAEETGLILPLGHWVLTAACKQLVAWAAQPETAYLTLAVNVSAKQIHLPTFVEEVLTLVDHFGVDPTKLKLEITESMLLDNVDATIANMSILKARGISFSMDDFGTGYSSLQYLKRLPLDQLKIDRSFVHDIATDDSDKAIVGTIIAMAKNLNLNIIAEGVETVAQQQLLKDKGCTAFQGYLLGRPIPIEQFEALLK
jgi:diguanylate cyclase (GGDEF)-like protein/PAS domain S-box-containing protein